MPVDKPPTINPAEQQRVEQRRNPTPKDPQVRAYREHEASRRRSRRSRIMFRVIQMPTMPLKDFSGNPLPAVAERSQWRTARTPNGTLCDGRLLRGQTDANSHGTMRLRLSTSFVLADQPP